MPAPEPQSSAEPETVGQFILGVGLLQDERSAFLIIVDESLPP
jgi:hypothetical protein